MVFNIPKQHDEWLTFQFLLFFLIGFGINVFTNGQATLYYFDTEYNLDNQQYFTDEKVEQLKDVYQKLSFKNDFILYSVLFMYFILSPLINFYYGFKIFKKGQWKHLKRIIPYESGGNFICL